jgi:hypothetical protein
MAKDRKKSATPEPPIMPRVGDKVTMKGSNSVRHISRVYPGGDEVDVEVPRTNLQWFRVKADTLTYVERTPPAKTSNPFTTPEPTLDAAAVLERIDIVRRESLKRIDDDIDILKSYLRTEDAPKAAIEALETLTVDQHVNWKKAIEKVKKALE